MSGFKKIPANCQIKLWENMSKNNIFNNCILVKIYGIPNISNLARIVYLRELVMIFQKKKKGTCYVYIWSNHAISLVFNSHIMPYKLTDIIFISMKHICSRNSWNVLAWTVYKQHISTKDYSVYHESYYILISSISYRVSGMLTPSTFSVRRYSLGIFKSLKWWKTRHF